MAEPRRPQSPARPAAPRKPRATADAPRASRPAAAARTGTVRVDKPRAEKPRSGAARRSAAGVASPSGQDRAARSSGTSPSSTASRGSTPRALGPLGRVIATVTKRGSAAGGSSRPAASAAQPRSGAMATPWAKVSAASSTVTTRMEDRLRERRSAQRRLLTGRWAKRALIGVAGAVGVWLLLLSPVFALEQDKVEASGFGTVVDPASVEEIVAQQDGTSLVLVNTRHIEDQLEALVGVRDAVVERVWPAGLRVTLTSAEPVAAIPHGETFVLLDEDGVQVDEAQEAPEHLPVVNVPIDAENTRILDGVIAVIDQMPAELRERVQDVEATTEDSIHFVLRDGPRVEWGSAEESALKAEVLAVLLQEASDAELIDVSAPTLPTVV